MIWECLTLARKKNSYSIGHSSSNYNQQTHQQLHTTDYASPTNAPPKTSTNTHVPSITTSAFIPQFLINHYNTTITSTTYYPLNLDATPTPASIIISVAIALLVLLRMTASFILWGKYCRAQSEQQAIEIEMEEHNSEEKLENKEMKPQKVSIIDVVSLSRAFTRILSPQQSTKILCFSYFKLFSIPLLVYGYIFYLNNLGTDNYLALDQQVYTSFYFKISILSYYLPDIFFMISGYLLTIKMIQYDRTSQHQIKDMLKYAGVHLIRLYPLYLGIVLVYWWVSPTLHAGPLWVPYKLQVQQCNYTWWRAILLIDNWFTDGCYQYGWFVQVQAQLTVIGTSVFLLYNYKRIAAQILLTLLYIASTVTLFLPGAPLPHDLLSTIAPASQLYFQAVYSHAFFYFSGMLLALAFDMQIVTSFFKQHFVNNKSVFAGALITAFGTLIFIIMVPSLWEELLKFQLALCRIGVLLCFVVFFLDGMVNQQKHWSYIHKLSSLSYGIILSIGLVGLAGFWGLQNFNYISGMNILRTAIPTLFIAMPLGILLQLTFDLSPIISHYCF